MRKIRRRALCLILLSAMLLLTACAPRTEAPAPEVPAQSGLQVLVDGTAVPAGTKKAAADVAQVWFTLDGSLLLTLPFAEAHAVTVLQEDGSENTIRMTGAAVYMEKVNCPHEDCVQMGEITLENLEYRPLGGFLVCLPHRLVVEVREHAD